MRKQIPKEIPVNHWKIFAIVFMIPIITITIICSIDEAIQNKQQDKQVCVPKNSGNIFIPIVPGEPIVIVMPNTPQHVALSAEVNQALSYIQSQGGKP